jgi:hypothetical protein
LSALLPARRHSTTGGLDEPPPPQRLPQVKRWGMSPLDWRAHAIDEQAQHPYGLYLTPCGHQLLAITVLHESPPGRICPTCAEWTSK